MNRIALIALLLFAPAAWSQEDEIKDGDMFRLWDNCNPMDLMVFVEKDPKNIVLAEEDVETAVRSRLRAARLYDEEAINVIIVEVLFAGSAFGIQYTYSKGVQDLSSGLVNLASTWHRVIFGSHGQNPSFVLSRASYLVDLFVDEYLRVNESACQKQAG